MAIDKTVDFDTGFAHRAIAGRMAFISDKIVFIINAANGEAFAFIYAGEDRADTCRNAVIITNGIDGGLNGITRGNGCRQNQYVLADDHRSDIIAENDLASACIFGSDDVNGAVRIHVHVAGFGQFACHASADHFCAIQADDRIDDLRERNLTAHNLGACARFGKTMLGHSKIDIIIQVAMCGCKMSFRDTKRKICVLVTIFD